MIKRMIDADALLEALGNKKPRVIINPPVAIGYGQAMCDIEELINELATPAPTPQESIFDAGGWCFDLSKAPIYPSTPLLVKTIDGYTTTYNFYGLNKKDHVCWRFIFPPTLPTGGNNDK